jgi:hypothetical protein
VTVKSDPHPLQYAERALIQAPYGAASAKKRRSPVLEAVIKKG